MSGYLCGSSGSNSHLRALVSEPFSQLFCSEQATELITLKKIACVCGGVVPENFTAFREMKLERQENSVQHNLARLVQAKAVCYKHIMHGTIRKKFPGIIQFSIHMEAWLQSSLQR